MRRIPGGGTEALNIHVERDGWAVVPAEFDAETLDAVATEFEPSLRASSGKGGVRNLLDLPFAAALAAAGPIRRAAVAVLGESALAVRGILFDKTPAANWRVPWHQDLTVALARSGDAPGFGPWSEKDGVPHAQAPTGILERMLAVTLHLDPSGPDNGPVRVLPGGHRSGKLDAEAMRRLRETTPEVEAVCGRGELLLFRPLLPHASSPAVNPGRRRVLHFEFAEADVLPAGLEWRWRVGGPPWVVAGGKSEPIAFSERR